MYLFDDIALLEISNAQAMFPLSVSIYPYPYPEHDADALSPPHIYTYINLCPKQDTGISICIEFPESESPAN